MTEAAATPDEWAIVEIMGHLRRAGLISEVDRFGAKLLRVDIPIFDDDGQVSGFVSEFFSGSAIYRLRPCSEEVARVAAQQIGDPRPVVPMSFRLAGPERNYDDHDLQDVD